MKNRPHSSTRSILAASVAALCAFTVTTARADTFGSGLNTFTIDFVTIGNAGNADDAAFDDTFPDYSLPYGGVSYLYRMGTYEISQAQIDTAKLAAPVDLLNVVAGAHTGNEPAANIQWYEAAAFVNWLNTSKGYQAAYDLSFSGSWSMTLWSSGQAWQIGGENLYRHKDAYYFLPSEDEWYKAAFHKNDGATANYWDYATGSNTVPVQALVDGTTPFTAVFDDQFVTGAPADPADVNLAGGLSAYLTMGQTGNVSEWTESAVAAPNDVSSENRARIGGGWTSSEEILRSSTHTGTSPAISNAFIGFRVASVPEPSSTVLLISASLLASARRRRRAAL